MQDGVGGGKNKVLDAAKPKNSEHSGVDDEQRDDKALLYRGIAVQMYDDIRQCVS